MNNLRAISPGAVSGTNSYACPGEIFGGVLISTDGTNAAVVTVRKNDAAGDIVFQVSTKSPLAVFAPIEADATVHTVVTGTGATAQFFEWHNG